MGATLVEQRRHATQPLASTTITRACQDAHSLVAWAGQHEDHRATRLLGSVQGGGRCSGVEFDHGMAGAGSRVKVLGGLRWITTYHLSRLA